MKKYHEILHKCAETKSDAKTALFVANAIVSRLLVFDQNNWSSKNFINIKKRRFVWLNWRQNL